jgi:hypothetical protein
MASFSAMKDKADLYAKEVDRARLRGDWTGDTVGQEAKGKGVGWSELLRKYGKHNNTKQGQSSLLGLEAEGSRYWRASKLYRIL